MTRGSIGRLVYVHNDRHVRHSSTGNAGHPRRSATHARKRRRGAPLQHGQRRAREGEHAEPIFPTSSYVFRNAAEAAARFAETEKGNIYSRFTNPTVRCV